MWACVESHIGYVLSWSRLHKWLHVQVVIILIWLVFFLGRNLTSLFGLYYQNMAYVFGITRAKPEFPNYHFVLDFMVKACTIPF